MSDTDLVGLDLAEGLAAGDRRADRRDVDVDDVAEASWA
jgi:hypothetical protein